MLLPLAVSLIFFYPFFSIYSSDFFVLFTSLSCWANFSIDCTFVSSRVLWCACLFEHFEDSYFERWYINKVSGPRVHGLSESDQEVSSTPPADLLLHLLFYVFSGIVLDVLVWKWSVSLFWVFRIPSVKWKGVLNLFKGWSSFLFYLQELCAASAAAVTSDKRGVCFVEFRWGEESGVASQGHWLALAVMRSALKSKASNFYPPQSLVFTSLLHSLACLPHAFKQRPGVWLVSVYQSDLRLSVRRRLIGHQDTLWASQQAVLLLWRLLWCHFQDRVALVFVWQQNWVLSTLRDQKHRADFYHCFFVSVSIRFALTGFINTDEGRKKASPFLSLCSSCPSSSR